MDRSLHSLSLTPPTDMNSTARAGLLILSLGLLSILVALIGNSATPFLPLLFGLSSLVIGGVLWTKHIPHYKPWILGTFGLGIFSLIMVFENLAIPATVLYFLIIGF